MDVKIIETNSGPLAYRECGQGPVLVLLHANPGDSQDFTHLMPQLAENYRCIALDWPGYGQSPLNRPLVQVDFHFFRGVLTDFLNAMGLQRVMLLGNSLGGYVACDFARLNPLRVAQLILISPGGFSPDNLFARFFCRTMSRPWGMTALAGAKYYLKKSTEFTRAMQARARGVDQDKSRKALYRHVWFLFAGRNIHLTGQLADIHCPVLLIFGKKDPFIRVRADGINAMASLPHAQFKLLPGGHAPFAEVPELFKTTLQDFLAGKTFNGPKPAQLRTRYWLKEAAIWAGLAAVWLSLPYFYQPAADAREIIVYSSPDCGYCKKLERDLNARHIPYENRVVRSSVQGFLGFMALRGSGVPLIVAGDQVIHGYNKALLDKQLHKLGYTQ